MALIGDSSQDWRFNPITETEIPETISDEIQTAVSLDGLGGLVGFQLTEVPLQGTPSSIVVTRNSDSQIFTEVSTTPGSEEFFVDYKYQSGLIIVNASETGEDFTVSYKGLGAVNSTKNNQKTVTDAAYPVGSIIAIDTTTPFGSLPTTIGNWIACNGQVISDAASTYNTYRVRNLNGQSITGISISALDNTAKTVTVSNKDSYCINVGDTLTFTGTFVGNAIVKAVNYSSGLVTVGDSTIWSSGAFGLTTGTLTGATALSVSSPKRFISGFSSSGDSGIDTMQGHYTKGYTNNSKPYTSGGVVGDYLATGTAGTSVTNGALGSPISDGSNGTPRTWNITKPAFVEMTYYFKFK
jgi:hypothetical protein